MIANAADLQLIVQDLRSKRLSALVSIGSGGTSTAIWNSLVPESLEVYNGAPGSAEYLSAASKYIDQLEAKIPTVIAGSSSVWTLAYWKKEASALYKGITGEADTSGWSIFGVLGSTIAATAEQAKDALPSKGETAFLVTAVVVALVALAVIRVA
jgi:hypothetical protein